MSKYDDPRWSFESNYHPAEPARYYPGESSPTDPPIAAHVELTEVCWDGYDVTGLINYLDLTEEIEEYLLEKHER